MAFKYSFTDARGVQIVDAYCRVTVLSANRNETVIQVLGYVNREAAPTPTNVGYAPVLDAVHSVLTTEVPESTTPINYAYKQLENSGLYPNATWNI